MIVPSIAYVGWGWWWWWWIAIIVFFWFIFLPPFGWGRSWYGRYYGGRMSGYGGGVPVSNDFVLQWRAVEARFVDAPQSAAAEADRIIASLMNQRTGDATTTKEYQQAHDVVVRSEHGTVNEEELRNAMLSFRTIFRRIVGVDPTA